MAGKAKLTYDGKEYEFNIIEGSEGERAIDISNLRAQTGLVTLDTGYMNTGSCQSAITFIDANWTCIDKMKQWADKLGNQPSAA